MSKMDERLKILGSLSSLTFELGVIALTSINESKPEDELDKLKAFIDRTKRVTEEVGRLHHLADTWLSDFLNRHESQTLDLKNEYPRLIEELRVSMRSLEIGDQKNKPKKKLRLETQDELLPDDEYWEKPTRRLDHNDTSLLMEQELRDFKVARKMTIMEKVLNWNVNPEAGAAVTVHEKVVNGDDHSEAGTWVTINEEVDNWNDKPGEVKKHGTVKKNSSNSDTMTEVTVVERVTVRENQPGTVTDFPKKRIRYCMVCGRPNVRRSRNCPDKHSHYMYRQKKYVEKTNFKSENSWEGENSW